MPPDGSAPGALTETELASLRASHAELPRRVRDVIYGQLAERARVVNELLEMKRQAAARFADDPDLVTVVVEPIDNLIAILAACAHIPEDARVPVPHGGGATLAALSAAEREHFGRDY